MNKNTKQPKKQQQDDDLAELEEMLDEEESDEDDDEGAAAQWLGDQGYSLYVVKTYRIVDRRTGKVVLGPGVGLTAVKAFVSCRKQDADDD